MLEDENLQIYLTLLTQTSTYSWLGKVTWKKYQKQGRQETQLAYKGIAIRSTTKYSTAAMRARYWNNVFKAMKKNNSKSIQLPK